jgi:hypothetical protein
MLKRLLALFFVGLLAFSVSAEVKSDMLISLSSGDNPIKVRAFIVDPQGRRFGRDPRTGVSYYEVPNTGYDLSSIAADDGSEDATPEGEDFYIGPLMEGTYMISVYALSPSTYTLLVGASDNAGKPYATMTTTGALSAAGVSSLYHLSVNPTPGLPGPVLVKYASVGDAFNSAPFATQLVGSCMGATLSANARIEGAALSGGPVTMSGNSRIVGPLTSPKLTRSGNARVEGQVTISSSPVTCSFVDMPALMADLQATNDNGKIPAKYLSAGKLKLKRNDKLILPSGRFLLEGLELSDNATLTAGGTVNILSKGQVIISGNAKTIAANPPALMVYTSSNGGAAISGNGEFKGVLYAPRGKIGTSGNGKLFGRAFGKKVDMAGDSLIVLP